MAKFDKIAHLYDNFFQEKAEKLPFKDGYFDLITIIDAFYYFKEKERVISECYRTLSSNGFLLILTPSVDTFFSRLLVWSSRWFPTEKETEHLSFKILKILVEKHGLRFIKKDLNRWIGKQANLFFFNLEYWNILFKKQEIYKI